MPGLWERLGPRILCDVWWYGGYMSLDIGSCCGWIAAAMTLFGMYIIGQKRRAGFAICFAGEAFWVGRGLLAGMPDLIVLCVIFSGMHAYNWWQWGEHD